MIKVIGIYYDRSEVTSKLDRMLSAFKLFYRVVQRNKLFSFVNLLGLTLGFFSSIVIYLYVENELSYDQFHEKGSRIYRVNQTFIWGDDNPNQFSSTGPGVAYAIEQEMPEIEHIVKIHTPDMMPVRFRSGAEEQFFDEETVYAVDANFFEVFSFPLLHGEAEHVLDQPYSVVLSQEVAQRYFGSEYPVGKSIDFGTRENRKTYKVTGVAQTIEENTRIDFDMVVSLSSFPRMNESKTNDNWLWTMFETYIVVNENADEQALQKKLSTLPSKHATTTLSWMGYTWEQYIEAGKEWNLYLQPFEEIYLHSAKVYNRVGSTGDLKTVTALIGSAIFLMVLSCINFVNLSTAQFTTRAKGVAVRKVLGGSNVHFIQRFFGESLLYCVLAASIAAFFVRYTLPTINPALGTDIHFSPFSEPTVMIFMVILVVAVSALAGFYPFLFFNAFKPLASMKGEMKTGKHAVKIRGGMLTLQYMLSLMLIIGTFTTYKQLNFFLSADVGYEKERLLLVNNVDWIDAQEAFANELGAIERVSSASLCSASPLYIASADQFTPDRPDSEAVPLNFALGDEQYLETLGVEVLVGRGFDASYASDSAGVVLNAIAASTMGWEIDECILNRKIKHWSGEYHVVGVTANYNFWSLHSPIEPFAVFHTKSAVNEHRLHPLVMLKVRGEGDLQALDNEIESVWNDFSPNRELETIVLNDRFDDHYQREARLGKVLSFFSVLTVLIASLGLFGIVVFTIEQKLKEIGLRKVLGASLSQLILLFSKGYVRLLLVALILVAPLSYWIMESWLSDFEYRIEITPGIYLYSFGILLVISMVITVFHTSKASLMNPAEVLKDE